MPINRDYSYPFHNPESLVDLDSLCPPLSITMPVQSAWKSLEKVAAVAMNGPETPFHLSELDFPALDSKPEVDDFKVNKGRRNANEQLLAKKLAGQAFVLKQVVGQTGKQVKIIGKKRRARLLSENSEDMKLNVPYSLNRKNRWELESSADCLKERRSDEHVQFSALDQHLTAKGLSPSKEVLAFHEVNEEGAMSSRKAQSNRGATLSELNAMSNDEKPLSIRYVLAKAHPHGKGLIAGSLDKAKPLPRSTKRAQLDISVYSTDDGEPTEDEYNLMSPGATEETIQMYKPKNQTYSLADFVRDENEVALARAQRSRHVPLDSYVQVEMPDVQEESESTSVPTSPTTKLGQPMSLMKTMHVPSQNFGIVSRDDWLRQCAQLAEQAELRFQWLNAAHCNFQMDATSLLTSSKTPRLVLTVAYDEKNSRVRLIFNRSQECVANWRAIDAEFAKPLIGFNGLLQVVVKNAKVSLKNQSALSNVLSPEFNSTQLSTSVTPLDNYSLLYGTQPTAAQTVEKENQDEEDGDFDDFEHVEMEEFVDSDQVLDTKWRDASLDEQVAQLKTLCDECGENDTTKIILLDQCGHSFCFRCFKASLYQQICENVPLLRCSFNNCSCEVPAVLLQSIFELPTVAMTLQSCAESKAKKLSQQMFNCPAGCGLAVLDSSNNKTGQIQCGACKNHFCFNCHNEPHWPLNCEQNQTWSRKRELQNQKLCDEEDPSKNEINQQFWSVCDEARKRRTDVQVAHKVGKDVLKRVGYKLERQFSEMRKACLQVVENGYAYLYITRNNRPSNWSTIKSQLASLYRELNSFENALVYGSQNADKMAESMQKMRVHLRKTCAEIRPQQ